MESWRVPDALALELIGFAGKLGRDGKRPRFRLSTRQVKTLGYLEEIDHTARILHGDVGRWLRRRQRAAPFDGQTALDAMSEGGIPAMDSILRLLTRGAMKQAMRDRHSSR